jgi:predicted dehydrogenase
LPRAVREEIVVKVALVGCGKIADAHASQIQRIKGCEIVAVCDREILMARQLYERFPVKAYYGDLATMLREAAPDVVHITTSPESHFALAKACLEADCHVYVEKPFTLYEHEARELIDLANQRGRKITAGHDGQFSHVARRMRALIREGYLGNGPVHMESVYCYEMGESAYVRAFLGDKNHWLRRLPGMLLQNIISHGVACVAEHLTSDSPTVVAHGLTSPFLKSRGETEIVDELRVIISEESGATAYFTFSSQMRPALQTFRIYGDRNGLIADFNAEMLFKLRGARYKSFAAMFVPPLVFARQCIGNLRTNLHFFRKKDFHLKSGMKCLIESFYRSIEAGTEAPIPYREIVLTARIMDAIFQQIDQKHLRVEPGPDPSAAALETLTK